MRKVKDRITYPNGTFYELKKKDISRIRLNSEWRQLKLSFPNPVPGCIIEYSYEIIVNDVFPVEFGGFRLAFEQAGYHCVYSCEIDEACQKVYYQN